MAPTFVSLCPCSSSRQQAMVARIRVGGQEASVTGRPSCAQSTRAAAPEGEILGRPRGEGSAAERPLWSRQRRERYIVLQSIGSGTFGDVSLAIDLLTNRRVAIKQQNATSDTCRREFALMGALEVHPHPNVAIMLDYFSSSTAGGLPKLSTVHPLADSTLWRVYRAIESTQLPITDARLAVYMRGVVAGLGHLHTMSIVHADASLKNMLLMPDDVVVVADFGAAHSAINFILTAGDEITTAYVRAPERLLGDPTSLPSVTSPIASTSPRWPLRRAASWRTGSLAVNPVS